MLLKNKWGIVTGANRGIGYKILETFSQHSANIFACAREINDDFLKKKEELENKYSNQIIPIKFDLSNKDVLISAVAKINEQSKQINFLVNNSAVMHNKLFQLTKMDDFYKVFEINFFNQVFFTQSLMRNFIKNKDGSIVFLSSSAAEDGNIGRSVYSSSKAALTSFAKVISRELGPYNVRVNVISPGLINTDMMKNSTDQIYLENIIKEIPLRRIGETIDVANLALFLVSDFSKYLTGREIRIDGGLK